MDRVRLNMIADSKCAFCESDLPPYQNYGGETVPINCPCCGLFRITGSAIEVIARWSLPRQLWAAIAYQVRRMTDRAEPPRFDTYVLQALKDTARLPHPDQIHDDFVVWLGGKSAWGGWALQLLSYKEYKTLLGAVDASAFNYMAEIIHLSQCFQGTVKAYYDAPTQILGCTLTPFGWQRFRELNTVQKEVKHGFIAMKYGDPELDAVTKDHFVPQVRLAGFELVRLDDNQPAGLIDDQLRVRIRTSRFLVCDLTHGNRGAYWEAGFAEGLGLPVIYTCRRDVFDDKKHESHPHFDTNHLVTVIWDRADPTAGARKLKDIVRATLPSESILQDFAPRNS